MAKPKPTLPSYPSMKAMASATGIPLEWLKDAKAKGCPAFRQNNSVSLGDWLKWFGAQGDDEADVNDALKWSEKFARVKTWMAEIDLSKKRGEVVDRKEHQEALTSGMAALFGELIRVFCTELPPALKGLSELEIQRRCDLEIQRLRATLRQKFAEMGEKAETETAEETKEA